MRIENQRRSDNFEDRGAGRGGGGGGLPVQALFSLMSLLGFKGTLVVGAVLMVGAMLVGHVAHCRRGISAAYTRWVE